MKPFRHFTLFAALLMLVLSAGRMQAADYVDNINNASTKNAEGRRVIYEMNVGSFTTAGTLNAAQERLAELKQTGIDIVWLMPIYPRGTSGSPYAATNFQQVNPKYGSISDLKAFVQRAHELQMEVWLDWVPNHTATNADWVTSHPEYYAKSGGQMIHPNNYSDVWQLDYNNAGLVDAMNDCLKFWIDEADIDGYRCDYISSPRIPTSYWQTAIPLIKSYKEGMNITFLGEADIVQDATRLKDVGFDYDYAWKFQSDLANFGPSGNAAARLKAFSNTLIDKSSSQSFERMVYLTNHDQNFNDGGKTLTQQYGQNRYPLTVLTFTIYGMPLIYNGQETGGNQILNYFSDTKINWGSPDSKMLNTLRTLSALKHSAEALSDRVEVNWVTVTNNTSVLAYTKKMNDSEVLVVLNLATTEGQATLTGLNAGAWSLWLNSETIAQGTSRKQVNLSTTQTFTLDAKGYRVYVRGTFLEEELPPFEAYTPKLDNSDEISIFFETTSADAYSVWVWGNLGGGEAYCNNTSWPGDGMSLMGQTETGSYIYKYVITKVNEAPQFLIISKNGGNTKIYDGIAFVNHGYYLEGKTDPTQIISEVAGIRSITDTNEGKGLIFDLSGRKFGSIEGSLPRGIYIRDGRKFMVR